MLKSLLAGLQSNESTKAVTGRLTVPPHPPLHGGTKTGTTTLLLENGDTVPREQRVLVAAQPDRQWNGRRIIAVVGDGHDDVGKALAADQPARHVDIGDLQLALEEPDLGPQARG